MSTVKADVGVVIPTYNRAPLLQVTLESVLSQTLLPAQIVIIDDGSTDDTAEVVAQIREKAGSTEVIYLEGPHENRKGMTRNRGVAALRTPLIAFLDSDDIWKPVRLERQLEAWEKDAHAGFAFCNVQYFDETGLIGGACLPPARDFSGHILGDILEEPRAVPSTLIVKREAFERIGGFRDLRTNEDYELTLRLAAEYRAAYLPEILVLMREHAGRTSRQAREHPLLDTVMCIEDFLAERPDLPRPMRNKGLATLANMHYKLARLYTDWGDARSARSHLKKSLRLRPWDRRALALVLRLPGR